MNSKQNDPNRFFRYYKLLETVTFDFKTISQLLACELNGLRNCYKWSMFVHR